LSALATEVGALGGAGAPSWATARLHDVLIAALREGAAELEKARSGYEAPVEVAIAAMPGDRSATGEDRPTVAPADGSPAAAAPTDRLLVAATPAAAALRADPDAAGERSWLLVAAAVAALVELADPPAPAGAADLAIRAGDLEGFLVLGLPGVVALEDLDELAPLAFEDHAGGLDRLRVRAVAVPARVLDGVELREPIGETHPLRVAEAIARLGGRPADPRSGDALEDSVLALLQPNARAVRPHEDPEPARRVARRILQRLDGMGKWGGYHTDFAHLARGFAGNDRALAQEVGEALLAAGLLAEKPSVGQRHVFLNPRRAAEIRRLIDDGALPPGVQLP
jgi:hypothetical protein